MKMIGSILKVKNTKFTHDEFQVQVDHDRSRTLSSKMKKIVV